jgi:1,4-alpha-glucan branching enzyme
MEIKKQYLKSKDECKVTFKLPKDLVGNANTITLCGDFNEWNPQELEMKKLKTGEATLNLSLQAGKEYQYKVVLDGQRWENDPSADDFVKNEFGELNSLLRV